MSVALGIDTGGTYTDAVLVEYEVNQVLATAKALTTKHDLSICIRQAMDRVLSQCPADVRLVSLSTTLATNAIVEGNGAPICALLIGYPDHLQHSENLEHELGTSRYAFITGGHNTTGEEQEPLDLQAARQAIAQHAPYVQAFAVSGYFGTRNPEHELAIRLLVQQMTGKPVTCGSELTHRLDALRRATTVALNARLIPLLCDLIDAVETAMAERHIVAPLMVVKGDGSLMRSTMARERPIETILSGPAASVVGAQHLAGGKDVVVVDMGGTTTDIAVIKSGHPYLNPQGASVGPWRTMVEAIDVHTVGLGGDSRIWLDDDYTLNVGPRRVVPICMLAVEYPGVVQVLQQQVARGKMKPTDGEFLVLQRATTRPSDEQAPFEQDLYAALRQGPCSMDDVYTIMRHPFFYARQLDALERSGVVVRAGLTPTDAAHVRGQYVEWNAQAAHLAAELLARRVHLSPEDLCDQILARTAERVSAEVVVKLLHDDSQNGMGQGLDSQLLARALKPVAQTSLACDLTLRPPLVAIGAPVHTYFPMVANLLHGTLEIPKHSEVANALGAVAGSVVQRTHALIVPQQEEEGFRVHLSDQVQVLPTLPEALAYAESRGRTLALEGALRAGADDVQIHVERQDHSAPVSSEWGEEVYLHTEMDIIAIGRPHLAHR